MISSGICHSLNDLVIKFSKYYIQACIVYENLINFQVVINPFQQIFILWESNPKLVCFVTDRGQLREEFTFSHLPFTFTCTIYVDHLLKLATLTINLFTIRTQ